MDDEIHENWAWAIERKNWITATYVPGILNVEADIESRETETRTEWMLNKEIFWRAVEALNFTPDIDLFATRINKQLDQYVSYIDLIQAANVFTIDWKYLDFSAFPLFICLPKAIQKMCNDEAMGILVVPGWPNQPW